ncbi:hypothetical protein RhiirA5_412233 [Rhizophagus irregularis]|uniref:Uncharacterized protein n=1 Tax=Rhizophagus irregularis TaxID=588596 RepID=A0A2N0PZB4_9GLOM|nr:hypothetical protein RhiirA5_412233 [Rhizophagus irregularis]
MISENKENDRKSHKLDDDGGDVDGGVRSIGIIGMFAQSLYSIADIQFCVDRSLLSVIVFGSGNWINYCGSKKIIVVPSSFHGTNTHPSPFNESVFNNADVIILSDLYDKDILMEIRNCVGSGYLPRDSKRCTCQIILTPHQDMVEQSLLYYAYKKNIRNTCVVFANQPSLCSGESINFIRNWENNSNIQ